MNRKATQTHSCEAVLLQPEEQALRLGRLRALMAATPDGPDALLIADHGNQFALTGRVFEGWVYVSADERLLMICFVRRPRTLTGDNVVFISRPADIAASLGLNLPSRLGLELDSLPFSSAERMAHALCAEGCAVNASPIMRQWRSVKTPEQVAWARRSGEVHAEAMRRVAGLFRPGMTDIELEIEVEYLFRRMGNLGLFRISGSTMETFMGTLVSGENADFASPYDFAMGGAGLSTSLPCGADGSEIRPGHTVMVDLCGAFTPYMTDLTRVFAYGDIPDEARRAHDLSIAIHRELCAIMLPGTPAKALYERAVEMTREAGLERYFMGYTAKAPFIGHGVGFEINEAPVLAPRSRDILEEGNVIALEPKFVIPGVGGVGIEDTYAVTSGEPECLTAGCPREIIQLLP